MRPRFLLSVLFLCALPSAVSCSSDLPTTTGATGATEGAGGMAAGSGSGSGSGGGGGGSMAVCKEPTKVACADTIIQQMNLQSETAPGLIESASDGSGWLSTIDATAGGAFSPNPHAYVYGRFTEKGLEKVAIDDETSLESMDWDIAFRRYVIRINSADSGPSCVTAARVPGMVKYEDLTTPPDTLTFRSDDYYTESCEFIPDGTGLESSPETALRTFWEYPGCVKMTGNVFVVELRDGRRLKLTVSSYYKDLEAQKKCDTTGDSGMAAGATIRMRWAFLP